MPHYNFPMPAITADIIIFRFKKPIKPFDFAGQAGNVEVLLVRRAKEPFVDHWAIVGGHFDVLTDPSILDCAVRELKEETHIEIAAQELIHVGHYDKINRDPRGRYVTFLYAAECPANAVIQADDDVKEYQWFNLTDLPRLAFDHHELIADFADIFTKEDNDEED